jgi:hypothetical protein
LRLLCVRCESGDIPQEFVDGTTQYRYDDNDNSCALKSTWINRERELEQPAARGRAHSCLRGHLICTLCTPFVSVSLPLPHQSCARLVGRTTSAERRKREVQIYRHSDDGTAKKEGWKEAEGKREKESAGRR